MRDRLTAVACDRYPDRVPRFEILHNPRCSKSRQTLERLHAAGVAPAVIEYLAEPPPVARLEHILRLLGTDDPRVIMRTGEPLYRELGLAQVTDRRELLAALAAHPILIERPIVILDDGRAVIGRPPERVEELLAAARATPE